LTGIAGGVELLRARVAHDDLAGVHPRPQGDAHAAFLSSSTFSVSSSSRSSAAARTALGEFTRRKGRF
jgi:hypothetical protein